MNRVKNLTVNCPRCNYSICAKIKGDYKFFIYLCPKCGSNVVYYANKVTIISDKLFKSLRKRKNLKYCGEVVPVIIEKDKTEITKDMITDLKILLETETDFNNLISKL